MQGSLALCFCLRGFCDEILWKEAERKALREILSTELSFDSAVSLLEFDIGVDKISKRAMQTKLGRAKQSGFLQVLWSCADYLWCSGVEPALYLRFNGNS